MAIVSVPQIIFLPPVLVGIAGLALYNFQNMYQLISFHSKGYTSNPILRTIQPILSMIRVALEKILGKASTLKINFSHVMMMAIILMLTVLYNSIERNNELQKRQIQLMEEKKKKA